MAVDTRDRERLHEETVDLRVLAETLPTLSTYERSVARRRILAFLHEHVEAHTGAYGLLLYPEVHDRPGEEPLRASLSYDHLAIRHWIELLAAADVVDTGRMQALLYGLDALIRVQKWKENELVLVGL